MHQFFLGHIIDFDSTNGTYGVYFLFGKMKFGLRESDIKSYDGVYTSRAAMLDCDFYEEGDDEFGSGVFRVRQILNDKNEYKCVRLSGGSEREAGQIVNFDIGYVIKTHEAMPEQYFA